MSRRALPPVTRRAVLGAALTGGTTLAGAALLGGCDADGGGSSPSSSPTSSGSSPGSPSAPGGGPAPAGDPDRVLVEGALASTESLLAALGAVTARWGRLRDPLVAMHQAHRDLLRAVLGLPADDGSTSSPGPAPEAGLTRTGLRVREAALQAELVAAAIRAEDGAVARLLAVLSAAVAQQLLGLPEGPLPPPAQAPSGGPEVTA